MLTNTRGRNFEIRRPVILISVMFFLSACGDSRMADLQEFVDSAFQDKKPAIEPLPPFEPYQAYKYEVDEDLDPFYKGNIITNRDDRSGSGRFGERPNANREKEPLEDFPLDALSMVGTMTQKDVPWVIVRTAQGTAHLATIGNYLGQNDGRITQIFPDEQRVVLVETVPDASGRWVSRDVEISIDEN